MKEIKGIQRAPALLVPIIGNVDILNGNEPMHDIAGHWKNLLEEIPHHLPKEQKQLFQNISTIGLNKESKRAVDYHKTAINLCIHLIIIIIIIIYISNKKGLNLLLWIRCHVILRLQSAISSNNRLICF